MPSGAANGLATGHTRNRMRGHWKAFHGDLGKRGSVAPLLRCNRCGHPTRTHLSQSRCAGESTPAAPPRDLPHSQEAWGPSSSRGRGTLHCRQNPPEMTHAGPQAQVHLQAGSTDHDGSAASTSEARKCQRYARPGHLLFPLFSYLWECL